jgi:very-short-patch-repair endonuclease
MTRISSTTKAIARRLRREMTFAERLLWAQLRQRELDGFKFRRQHLIGRFIVDFVCIEARGVIEIDGGQHAEQRLRDDARTAWLNGQGYRVLRFWNNEVLQDTDAVREAIRSAMYETCGHRR